MSSLGVPNAKDLAALRAQFDALSVEVAKLAKATGSSARRSTVPKSGPGAKGGASTGKAAAKAPAKSRGAAKKSAAAS